MQLIQPEVPPVPFDTLFHARSALVLREICPRNKPVQSIQPEVQVAVLPAGARPCHSNGCPALASRFTPTFRPCPSAPCRTRVWRLASANPLHLGALYIHVHPLYMHPCPVDSPRRLPLHTPLQCNPCMQGLYPLVYPPERQLTLNTPLRLHPCSITYTPCTYPCSIQCTPVQSIHQAPWSKTAVKERCPAASDAHGAPLLITVKERT